MPAISRRHFEWIFLNENVWLSIKMSLKFVPRGPTNNIPALVHIMAWCRPGDKPLSEPMMVSLPTHICVTRSQWVKVPQKAKLGSALVTIILLHHTRLKSLTAMCLNSVMAKVAWCVLYITRRLRIVKVRGNLRDKLFIGKIVLCVSWIFQARDHHPRYKWGIVFKDVVLLGFL